nr:uncharacterized protein C4orf45 [Misgurnus anguillicaudatus]
MKRAQQDTGQRVLFTGPDGVGDFRPKLDYYPRSIGIGPLPPDATSDLEYLFRAAPQSRPPVPKNCYTGEVGWGLQYSRELNRRTLISTRQNEQGRFHSDGVTHSQWHTTPGFWDKKLPCDRLPRNHNTNDTYSEVNVKQFPEINKQEVYSQHLYKLTAICFNPT